MNRNKLSNKIGGFILAMAVMPGIAIVGSATVQAQDQRAQEQDQRDGRWNRDGRGDRNRSDRNNQNRRDDRGERNRAQNRDDRYRDRDDRYRQSQRSRRVYGNNGGYGSYGTYGNGGYGNRRGSGYETRGFQDGLYTGASDANRGQNYNPQRSHFYRNTNDWSYREGFVRGYQQGYQRNGGGRGNRGRNNGVRLPW